MKKLSLDILPDKPFTVRDLMKDEVTRYQLILLEKDGLLEKIGHGLYRKTQDLPGKEFDTTEFEKACAVTKGSGYICLWSALYLYDLTDEFVEETWIMVPYHKIIRRDGIKCVRTRAGDWDNGIVERVSFKVSNIERTIIDLFMHKRHIALKETLLITAEAIRDRKTSLKKIVDLATKMGVFSSLRKNLELIS